MLRINICIASLMSSGEFNTRLRLTSRLTAAWKRGIIAGGCEAYYGLLAQLLYNQWDVIRAKLKAFCDGEKLGPYPSVDCKINGCWRSLAVWIMRRSSSCHVWSLYNIPDCSSPAGWVSGSTEAVVSIPITCDYEICSQIVKEIFEVVSRTLKIWGTIYRCKTYFPRSDLTFTEMGLWYIRDL